MQKQTGTKEVIVTEGYVLRNPATYLRSGDVLVLDFADLTYYVRRGRVVLSKMVRGRKVPDTGTFSEQWANHHINCGNFVEPDDELPPAPTSGLYLSVTGRRQLSVHLHRKAQRFPDDVGCVQLQIDGIFRTIQLDAVTARDLASDLYRMARQLEKDDK